MNNFNKHNSLILIFLCILIETCGYIIPVPKFELLPTNNILITIPDKDGLLLVMFHGAVNRKIETHQTGDYSITQMSKNYDNDWTLEIPNNFNESDILYYWLYAQFNGDGYWLKNKQFELKSIIQKLYDDENITFSPANCPQTITIITGSKKQICRGQLIFDETFTTFNETKWQREIKFNGYDGEFVLYDEKPQNLYIENGNLHIVPTLTNETGFNKLFGYNINLGNKCTEKTQIDYFCQRNSKYRILPPITSAKIRTKESFSFRYGRIDVRAKLPKGDWIFPQIFLEPLNNIYANEPGHEYLAGQMRIAFIRGNELLRNIQTRQFYHGSVLIGGIVLHNYQEIYIASNIREEHLGNNFHIYSILWTDNEIILYVDDKIYGTIANKFSNILPKDLMRSGNMEPFTEPFYISLGVGVGGYMNFPDNTYTMNNIKKPWQNDDPHAEMKFWIAYDKWIQTWNDNNNHLIVDYVKVWAV